MGTVVTVSSKYQIVLPREVRAAIGLSPGDQILVEVVGEEIVLRRRPKSYTAALRGLHRSLWRGQGEEYLRRERATWDR